MFYRFLLYLLVFFLFSNCDQINNSSSKIKFDIENRYKNLGFALVYNNNLKKIKKLENRSLKIYHKSLKKRSIVKITNPENGKYLIAEVKSNKIKFSNFYNSILSPRIAEELEINLSEPYIEISLVSKNSTFIAKKAKMFEEEKTVARKAPVDGIIINDLNFNQTKTEVFPSILLQLASTGEDTGELDDLLDRAADYYQKQVDALVDRMTTLIEPLLILMVGAVIALMVVLTYLPVFHLGSALQSGL